MVIPLLQLLALLLLFQARLLLTLVLEASQVWDVTLSQAVPEHSPTRSLLPRRPSPAVSPDALPIAVTSCTLVWNMVENVGVVLLLTPILSRLQTAIVACLVMIMQQSIVELVAG
jgi:hypothetical protein